MILVHYENTQNQISIFVYEIFLEYTWLKIISKKERKNVCEDEKKEGKVSDSIPMSSAHEHMMTV
jgi:hypothetical protein